MFPCKQQGNIEGCEFLCLRVKGIWLTADTAEGGGVCHPELTSCPGALLISWTHNLPSLTFNFLFGEITINTTDVAIMTHLEKTQIVESGMVRDPLTTGMVHIKDQVNV